MAKNYLNNQFLIATPALADSSFFHTVTYLCEHTQQGALGIIINRTTDLVLGDLLEQLNIKTANKELASTPIYYGGPVQIEHGFVLHQPLGNWQSTLPRWQAAASTLGVELSMLSSDVGHA